MLAFLVGRYGNESKDDAEVAIYWFASDWHGGQWSDLYSILSTSPYRPGPFGTLESEGEQVEMMYHDLESEFPQGGKTARTSSKKKITTATL